MGEEVKTLQRKLFNIKKIKFDDANFIAVKNLQIMTQMNIELSIATFCYGEFIAKWKSALNQLCI